MFIVGHMVQYCTTCPWRRCISQERLFSFNKICICRQKRHEYTYVQHDNNGNYSFICKKCNQRHNLKLTKPLQFYCTNDAKRKSETYHKWNRPFLEFCVHCLSHKIGQNIGFCWFCTNCKKHQLGKYHLLPPGGGALEFVGEHINFGDKKGGAQNFSS